MESAIKVFYRDVWYGKTRITEINTRGKKYDDNYGKIMMILFRDLDTDSECDRQTDGRADGWTERIAGMFKKCQSPRPRC